MRVSLDWLSDFVKLPSSLDALTETLLRAGIEVEAVHSISPKVSGVIVGEVLSVLPHPNADHLHVCRVSDGNEHHTVVCGAPNVAAGQKVAYAPIGAVVVAGEIVHREIRGQPSMGMLCALSELGIPTLGEGLWILDSARAEVGSPIGPLAERAAVFELGITPNRPDLLSHVGVAREISATQGGRLVQGAQRVSEYDVEASSRINVRVDVPSACRRYAVRVVDGVKVGPSPSWLIRRLEAAGQRSINNVVDATNYVMLELGQPLHAFDLNRLRAPAGGKLTLTVRYAVPGEQVPTLDGKVRTAHGEDLVIADGNGPVALAGVIGGAGSEVTNSTETVVIECACFDPKHVRRTAKRHGLRTESSYRFERGTDEVGLLRALDRCAQLLVEIAGGRVGRGVVEAGSSERRLREVSLRPERVKHVLGVDMPVEAMIRLLEPIGFACTRHTQTQLTFEVPGFRPDVTREVDLIEEVARRFGYDNIPETLPDPSWGHVASQIMPGPPLEGLLRKQALASGYSETVTYGFHAPSDASMFSTHKSVRMSNPLGEEHSCMRTSLVPGLLHIAAYHARHGMDDLRLFEIGRSFFDVGNPLPRERRAFALLLQGKRYGEAWYCSANDVVTFYDLSGVVQDLLNTANVNGVVRLQPSDAQLGTHPGACATIRVDDISVGFVGQLHPALERHFALKGPTFVAELDLDAMEACGSKSPVYTALPKFPGVRRDVAVVAPKTLLSEDIRQFLLTHAGGKIEQGVVQDVQLFDVYEGKGVPEGMVSLAFSIYYRSNTRTLIDAEIARAFDDVLQGLQQTLGVTVRAG